MVRTDHRDPAHLGAVQWQRAVVGEQTHPFARCLQRQGAGLGVAGQRLGQRGIAIGVFEQPAAELEGQHPGAGGVDQSLREAARAHGVHECRKGLPLGQFAVDPGAQGLMRRVLQIARDMVQRGELVHPAVIAGDDPVEAPLAAQHIAQQPGVAMRGHTVDLVITRHHRADRTAADDFPKRREEVFAQLTF